MAGRGKELGYLERTGVISLKEQLARTALRNVRLKGHTYVELREDNKKVIFFCVLCLAPCYSDSVLHDHLRGHLHKQMYEAAKATLLKQNPFPFNDGMLFFHTTDEDTHSVPSNGKNLLQKRSINHNENNLAIVPFNGNELSPDGSFDDCLDIDDLIIPDVIHKDKVTDLEVREIGVGKISIKWFEQEQVPNSKGITKIWCEWLGKSDSVNNDKIPYHDFGIITFTFDFDLGRKGILDDLQQGFLSSNSIPAIEKGKKRKSVSDPEDYSSNQFEESSSEESSRSCNSRNVLEVYDDNINSLQLRSVKNKCKRKEIRARKRLASERVCDICQHKMLPGKNVGTLLNMKTGRIVCSSRNLNGAFHVYHISCLIHWVLLCESEVYAKQIVGPEVKKKHRRKKGGKFKKVEEEGICCVFCPECQGTGILIDGDDELEKPSVSLSEMFKYKMKASDGHKEYIKNPELLQNCSTGFYFPFQSEDSIQEKVIPLKLLRFYHAVE